ncbi:hypothetical protein [Micromonospora coerulea]|uniref:hypothetical protein n=1 Tax=Micromonospora coerulea TaxID=47856 RepID=UPI001905EDB9|nr:hypothetical protein [Micromonospora veneta]
MSVPGAHLCVDLASSAVAAIAWRDRIYVPILFDGRPTIAPAGLFGAGGPGTVVPDGEHTGAPSDHTAELLRHVAAVASTQVGPISSTTFVIAPQWGPRRRSHLTQAAQRAGLPAPAMVTGPAALVAHVTAHPPSLPDGACALVLETEVRPPRLTVLQVSGGAWHDLATRTIPAAHVDDVLAHQLQSSPAEQHRRSAAQGEHEDDANRQVRESVRQARALLATQERAPVLLPHPRPPAVITRGDVHAAAQPLTEQLPGAVGELLDTADVDTAHLAMVVAADAGGAPELPAQLAAATGVQPVIVNHPHAAASGALTLTATPLTAISARLPRTRLRIRDLAAALIIGACALALFVQVILTADVTTIGIRVIGARTSLPQLGTAAALAVMTALAVAQLAPTTWLAGPPTSPTDEPTTAALIRRSYLAAAALGTTAAAFLGLAAGTSLGVDYTPHLKWALTTAAPLGASAVLIALVAPRIPAADLPAWLGRARPVILPIMLAAAGMLLMRAAVSLTPPADLIPAPGLVGSAGAAMLGAATALTATDHRTLRVITLPALGLSYAIVFTGATSAALIIGYCLAVLWWAIRLTAYTTRLAFPAATAKLRRLLDGPTVQPQEQLPCRDETRHGETPSATDR